MRQSLAVVVVILLSTGALAASSAKPPYPQHINHLSVSLLGGESATIFFGESTLYLTSPVPRDSSTPLAGIAGILPTKICVVGPKSRAVLNKYIKTDSGTVTFSFASSDPSVAEVSDGEPLKSFSLSQEAGSVAFLHGGKVTITVSARCQEKDLGAVRIPIEVVVLPVWTEMGKSQVIEKLGLPDFVTEGHLDFGEGKVVDGIYYKATDPNGLFYTHWFYDDYPGVTFEMDVLSRLDRVWQKGWYNAQAVEIAAERGNKAVDDFVASLNEPLPYWKGPKKHAGTSTASGAKASQ